MCVQRALSRAEYVVALAADDLPDEFPAMTHAANDLLDGHVFLRKSQDCGIGLLATKVTLVLDALGTGEQIRTDYRCANRAADLAHGLAYRFEESMASVLHMRT
jgi:hypothetical protein